MSKIIIIGGGLTGLSAAYHLEQAGITDYTLFEKEPTVGGLCRSVTHDGFTFDYTGHLLHLNDPVCTALVNNTVGLNNFVTIARNSYIYSEQVYTRYPYQINLHGLSAQTIADCLTGFIRRPKNIPDTLWYQWVLKHFGTGFARHFFVPFESKKLDFNAKKITSDWTGRFVPATSLTQIITGIQHTPEPTSVGYNAQFLYPRTGGIQFWTHAFARHIKKPIYTNSTVTKINTHTKTVTLSSGAVEPYTHLISTVPLDNLLDIITEQAHTNIKSARENLACARVININMGIARPPEDNKHWIYFPEKKYPCYRMGFYHNFSRALVPENCQSLYAEFAVYNRSRSTITERIRKTRKAISEIVSLTAADIITEKILDISHGYVIYNSWRAANLATLLTRLEQEYQIRSIGRYGAWKYSSMQEALQDGAYIAEALREKI